MRSSSIFEIDRGTLFGRIITNENANNDAYRAVPQDAHDLGPIHCEILGIFTHYGRYKIAVLQWTDFREGAVSSLRFVFLLVLAGDVYYHSFIYFHIFKYDCPVIPKRLLFGRQWN